MSDKIDVPLFSKMEVAVYAFLRLHAHWSGTGKMLRSFSARQLEMPLEAFDAAVERLCAAEMIVASVDGNVLDYEMPMSKAESELKNLEVRNRRDSFGF